MKNHRSLWKAGRLECHLCLQGMKGRQTFPGHFGYRETRRGKALRMADFVRKRATAEGGRLSRDPRADASDWAAYYPAIAEYMTLDELDGAPRATMTVLVFVEGGLWKCRVLDREEDKQAFVTAKSLTQLMDAVEAGLVADSLDWRGVQQWGKKK